MTQPAKHTPGKWTITGEENKPHWIKSGKIPIANFCFVGDGNQQANAAFIIEAVNSHESLLAEVERLKAVNKELVESLKEIKGWTEDIFESPDGKLRKIKAYAMSALKKAKGG